MKKGARKQVDRARTNNYKAVAENFYNGANVAGEYEYWNAAGVLIVRSAIAYADAVCIRMGGVKSQGDDHAHSIVLLKELVTDTSESRKSFLQLEKIISHKNIVSYSGEMYGRKDIDQMWKQLERFRLWAEKLLN